MSSNDFAVYRQMEAELGLFSIPYLGVKGNVENLGICAEL
jgi:hypothetical protein